MTNLKLNILYKRQLKVISYLGSLDGKGKLVKYDAQKTILKKIISDFEKWITFPLNCKVPTVSSF